jgi:hypothetical protein
MDDTCAECGKPFFSDDYTECPECLEKKYGPDWKNKLIDENNLYQYYEQDYNDSPLNQFVPEYSIKFLPFISNDYMPIKPNEYTVLPEIQIYIDDTIYTFVFGDDNGIREYVKNNNVIVPNDFCTEPLAYMNDKNMFLDSRGCYLIVTKNSNSILIGFSTYKILYTRGVLKFYIRESCVPNKYQGKRIISIINQVLLKTIMNNYKIDIFESIEIAIQNDEKTNGRINEALGFTNVDREGLMLATRADIETKLSEKGTIEAQLRQLKKENLRFSLDLSLISNKTVGFP